MVAAKDDELKAAVDNHAELKKALEARGLAGDLEQHNMLCEAQHLDELLVSKCFFVNFAGLHSD